MSVFGKIAIVIILVLSVLAVYKFPEIQMRRSAEMCARLAQQDEQIQCWLDIVRSEVRTKGIAEAMHVFSYVYDTYPVFANTGCHLHAHRVGDMAYYEFYLANPDFDALDLPQEIASCGYGFFHGFLEHLIQDSPSPDFITETCNYFQKRLGETMRDIRRICYHGSGHGLMLARTEEISVEDWGKEAVFTRKPLAACDNLKEATVREKEECREGVYNVLVDWMETKQYGFTYNDEHPFALCDLLPQYSWKKACYYEMAQKLDRLSEWDPKNLEKIVAPIEDAELRRTAFYVGAAGLIQNNSGTNLYLSHMRTCLELHDPFIAYCVESIVAGLFEHGSPQKEYEKAVRACELDEVARNTMGAVCWKAVAQKSERFYTPEKVKEVCGKFPEEFQSLCEKK